MLIGELIAGLGLWSGIIGNLEFMQEKVPSDFHKSLILASGLLASIFVGPLAGRIIDQSSKKKVLIVSGIARVISVLFMFVAIATGSIWWMVLFLVVLQVSAAFYFPALQSTLPLIVEERDLLGLNSWHMNFATVARVAGTALGGIALVYWPIQSLYIISIIAYAGLLFFTFFLKIEDPVKIPAAKNKNKKGFKEVFGMMKSYPVVLMTLYLTFIPILFLASFNLIVINISEIQDSSSIKGVIYAVEGIAFMIGTFAVKYMGQKWGSIQILFTFIFLIGLAELTLFFADIPFLSLLSFGIFGFSVGCFYPTAVTIFQKQVPKEFHGRFFSFRNMIDRVCFQVVLITAGAMLDIMGLSYMMLIFGSLSLSLSLVVFFHMRRKRVAMLLVSPEKVLSEN